MCSTITLLFRHRDIWFGESISYNKRDVENSVP